MKKQNEIKTTVKAEDRILTRQLATEMTMEELVKVSGGMVPENTTYCVCGCTPDDCGTY